MRNIKLILEYDGSRYRGWQIQQNAITVQEVVQKAIKNLTGEDVNLTGASRTDEGVHALGMAANFYTVSSIPDHKFAHALNACLPDDVVVKESGQVEDNFHARFWAKGKKYRYLVHNGQQPSALLRNRAWHVRKKLDVEPMRDAAEKFVGTHDFKGFCAAGSSVKTTVRTIHSMVIGQEEEQVWLEVVGDGFLYNMVRIIAGTLVQVGKGEIPALHMEGIIQSGDREQAGITAPPQGLYLVKVYYQEQNPAESYLGIV